MKTRKRAEKKSVPMKVRNDQERAALSHEEWWVRERTKMVAEKHVRGVIHDQVTGYLGSIERSLASLSDIQVRLAGISAHLGRIADATTERLEAERHALESVALKAEALKAPPPVVVQNGKAEFLKGLQMGPPNGEAP